MPVKKGLGRGLEALLPVEVRESDVVAELSVNSIRPNPRQPRKVFDEEKLRELAESIREHGVVQPVIVRNAGDGYEIVAGERRWRAAKMAGLTVIPAIIRQMSEVEVMEVALIENIQREDLNPIEEARAYQTLMNLLGATQEQLAIRVGKSRAAIANALRLLNLDEEVQGLVEKGLLSGGHARCLVALGGGSLQREVAQRVVEEGLSVRETEAFVRKVMRGQTGGTRCVGPGGVAEGGSRGRAGGEIWLRSLEEEFMGRLGTRVRITGDGNKGRIEVEYYSPEDLLRLVDVIMGGAGNATA